tara:strand:+ start:40 stop:375 length:336 start_codon:yes stop_codon:yes gene_type:complete
VSLASVLRILQIVERWSFFDVNTINEAMQVNIRTCDLSSALPGLISRLDISKKSPAFFSGGNLRDFNRDRSAFESQIFLTQDDPRINVFSKGLITHFFVSKAWHLEVILSN